jgi:hypothetical protein
VQARYSEVQARYSEVQASYSDELACGSEPDVPAYTPKVLLFVAIRMYELESFAAPALQSSVQLCVPWNPAHAFPRVAYPPAVSRPLRSVQKHSQIEEDVSNELINEVQLRDICEMGMLRGKVGNAPRPGVGEWRCFDKNRGEIPQGVEGRRVQERAHNHLMLMSQFKVIHIWFPRTHVCSEFASNKMRRRGAVISLCSRTTLGLLPFLLPVSSSLPENGITGQLLLLFWLACRLL